MTLLRTRDPPMFHRAVAIIPGLLRARDDLTEDLEEQIYLLREQEHLVKKLKILLFMACVLIWVVYKFF